MLLAFTARAQQTEKTDSLVRLLSAKSMEQVDRNGQSYRKVIGPARFFHNNTYLICDTAFWNMNTSIIECINNVSIVQEETKLTSDKLIYLVDDDLAQFRGSLVQLEDKDGNTLRTRHLDYNTRDSVATFMNGGAMKDKDGQIIESRTGVYESKIKLFTFTNNVNMFTDSVFIKTTSLKYYTDSGMAYFGVGTDAWKEENMLSADDGWYDRPKDLFLFKDSVHGMNDRQEMWADSLYFNRTTTEVELLGNAQITDTTRNAHSMAGRMLYVDSLAQITLTRNPVVIGIDKQKEKPDTVYARADIMIYRTIPMCDIDSSAIQAARVRLKDLEADVVGEYRKKAAEDAKRAAEEAKKNDPNAGPPRPMKNDGAEAADAADAPLKKDKLPKNAPPKTQVKDTVSNKPAVTDSLSNVKDSLATIADNLAPVLPDSTIVVPPQPKDSTKVGFMWGKGNFRLFKSDLQMVSDSLEYTDLDSLVRLYKRPLIWSDKHRQYSSDSLFTVIKNGTVEKASLMSEAFVIIQEDSLCYDQIRSAEMMAYFDSTGTVKRFDAMGDADAVFYIQEDSTYATVNFSKSKILSATFKDGDIDRVYYFDQAKSDAYPVAQIKQDQRELKGFKWQPSLRPASKEDIIQDKRLRKSQRADYTGHPRAQFKETEIYFPGYIGQVYEDIENAKMRRKLRQRQQQERERQIQDSLATAANDSLTSKDTLPVKDSISVKDSIGVKDSLSNASTALPDTTAAVKPLTEKELKALEKERIRKEKQEKKEREWARLDSLDAAKTAAKAAAKLEKERKKKIKALEKMHARQAEEDAILQKYIEFYRRKKAREDEAAALKAEQEALKEGEKEGENEVEDPKFQKKEVLQ